MPDLRDMLKGAVDHPVPLDLDHLGDRMARHVRRRRIVKVGAAATAIVLIGTATVVVLATGDNADINTGPSSPVTEGSTTTSARTPTTADTTTTSAPSTSAASVRGGVGGAPPCAEPGAGEYGASVEHPERAPLVAKATFGDGVHWAVCGADPVFSGDILNLRSADGGQSWSVTDTGLSLVTLHAEDRVDVQLMTATTGRIHLVSLVAERDELYETDDGGLTWQRVR